MSLEKSTGNPSTGSTAAVHETTGNVSSGDTKRGHTKFSEEMRLYLRSIDGEIFDVKARVAMRMMFIKDMVEDIQVQDKIEIPMGDLEGCELKKLLEYCQFEQDLEEYKVTRVEFIDFENSFTAQKIPVLVKTMMGSHFVNLPGLFDLTCRILAERIKERTWEDVHKSFAISK